MLVYANSFIFEPDDGATQIIQFVARWVGQRAKSYVDADRLVAGIRELHLKDGSTLSSRATVDKEHQTLYPYFFCARLSHADDKVPGRRWTTEIGIHQENAGKPLTCSILLKTDEVSARVTSLIQVTRPKLVQQLIENCRPVGQTPGLLVKRLDEPSATAFLSVVERDERKHPIVLISCTKNGVYPVMPERLRIVLVGLADVVEIPVDVDTYNLQEIVGRRYIAFGGAINVIFPVRRGDRGPFCEAVMFRPEEIRLMRDDGKSIESEVLAAITHRTNLPYSWRHISIDTVNQAVLRGQLSRMIDRAKSSDESAEYVALLEVADIELRAKDAEVEQLRIDLDSQSNEVRKLEAAISSLKYALSGRQTADESKDSELATALAPLRASIVSVLKGDASLEQALDLANSLYGDRLVVLDSAFDSAKDSDRGGFRYGNKAFELLSKLMTEYWEALAEGKGEQIAKDVFGQNAYSNNEGSALSKEGRRRRTFSYRGRDFLMEKHLKHGVKDSLAETLRVHFEWFADEQKIVIGHCGKHLDF